jgi:hypothetical protein
VRTMSEEHLRLRSLFGIGSLLDAHWSIVAGGRVFCLVFVEDLLDYGCGLEFGRGQTPALRTRLLICRFPNQRLRLLNVGS